MRSYRFAAARRREMANTAMLVASDLLAVLISFAAARLVRRAADRPFYHHMTGMHFAEVMVATLPVWVVIFAICGLYRVRRTPKRSTELGRVVCAAVGGSMLLVSVDYFSYANPVFPSRMVPLVGMLFVIVLVTAGRQIVRAWMRNWFRSGRALHNVIIVGGDEIAARIAAEVTTPGSGYRLVAGVAGGVQALDFPRTVPVFPTLEKAIEAMPAHRIDEIIQTDMSIAPAEAVRQMAFANENAISYRFVPDTFDVYAAASTMDTIAGIPVMEVRLTSLDGWGAVAKRGFDLLGAAVLIVLLSPLFAAVMLAQKISEPGAPIFYTQARLGLGGREIGVKKFRSMSWRYSTGPDREFKTAEEAFIAMGRADLIPEFQQTHKVLDDPRVSKLGAFLRKSSLDELPQLFNALAGDLSLVGPRPITQRELDRYGKSAESFLALKPGITGLWQVQGRSTTSYDERVKMDIYYVENWSLGMDVSILARTVVSVAARKGAA